MSDRRALVKDEDKSFIDLLRSTLGPLGFEIEATATPEDLLDKVATLEVELVFIAVDLPEQKDGFSLFSRVKGIAKTLPVVLATSTLPKADLALHQKLKIHADDYWDKRELTAAKLLRRTARIVPLPASAPGATPGEGPSGDEDMVVVDESELVDRRDDATLRSPDDTWNPPADETEPTAAGPGAEQGLSLRALEALIAELSLPASAEPEPNRSVEVSNEAGPAGDPEIARLREELEETRRIAKASPFSHDFFRLLEKVRDREKDILDLQRRTEAHSPDLAARTVTARQLAQQLLAALHLQKVERDRIAVLESEKRSLKEHVEIHRRDIRQQQEQYQRELEQLHEGLAQERRKYVGLHQQHEKALADREEQHAAALRAETQQRAAALATLETRFEQEKTQAIQEALEELRWQHQSQIAELSEANRRATAENEQEHLAQLRRASEQLTSVRTTLLDRLEEGEQQHAHEIAKLESEHLAAMQKLAEEQHRQLEEHLATERQQAASVLQKAHQEALAQLEASHQEALASRDREHQAEIKRQKDQIATVQAEAASRLDEARRQFESRSKMLEARQQAILAEHLRRHQTELGNLEKRLDEERGRAALAATVEVENRLEQERREHAQALAESRQELDQARQAWETAHRAELEGKERDHRQALESAAAEKVALSQRLREEKETALASAANEWRDRVAQIEQRYQTASAAVLADHEAKLRAMETTARERLERANADADQVRTALRETQQRLTETEKQQADILRQADRQREAALQSLESLLNQKRADALSAQEDEWQKKMDTARRQNTEAVAALRREHQSATQSLQAQHREALDRAAGDLKKALDEVQQLRGRIVSHEASQSELRKRAEAEREAALHSMESLLNRKKAEALAAVEDEWKKKMDRTLRQHEENLSVLRREQQSAIAAQKTQQREALERTGHELTAARAEIHQLQERISEQEAAHAALRSESEAQRDAAIQAAEAMLSAKYAEAQASLEKEWRQKIDDAERQTSQRVEALRRESEQAIAARESPLQEEMARLRAEHTAHSADKKRLERQLAEAQAAAAAQGKTIEALRRQIADYEPTINSLKAIIGDFSSQPLSTAAVGTPEEGAKVKPTVKKASG